MKLTRVNLASCPFVGWTPLPNTLYVVTDGSGKFYLPVPDNITVMAYGYLHDDMYNRLLLSDNITVDEPSIGHFGVEFTFITLGSPYAVKLTTVDGDALLTLWDSNDTRHYVGLDATIVKAHACHKSLSALMALSPVALWRFEKRYIENTSKYYIDDIGIVKLQCDTVTEVYPSGWSDASPLSARIPPIETTIEAEVNCGSDSPYFSFMVDVAVTGDCSIIQFGGIELIVTAGELIVSIGGHIHSTGQLLPSASIAGLITLAPSHRLFVTCDGSIVTLIVDGITVGTYPVVYGTAVYISQLSTMVIKDSTVYRQYSGIALFNRLLLPSEIICNPTQEDLNVTNVPIEIKGHNCTRYRVVSSAASTKGIDYIFMPVESQRALCHIHLFGLAASVVEYGLYVDGKAGISPAIVSLSQGESVSHDIWVSDNQAIIVKVIIGSVGMRITLIGEH